MAASLTQQARISMLLQMTKQVPPFTTSPGLRVRRCASHLAKGQGQPARYGVLVRTSSRILRAREGLKTPHEQKRASVAAAASGVRRFSLTKSIIFLASDALTMP